MPKEILIVEDDPLIAYDLKNIIEQEGDFDIKLAHNTDEAKEQLSNLTQPFVFLDINLEERLAGVRIAQHINKNYNFPFSFVTANTDEETLQEVHLCRPVGFVVKPFVEKEIIANLKLGLLKLSAANSQDFTIDLTLIELKFPTLTLSERQVLLGLYEAKSNPEIAENIHLSVNTVKSHLKTLYAKLEVKSRVEAVQVLMQKLK